MRCLLIFSLALAGCGSEPEKAPETAEVVIDPSLPEMVGENFDYRGRWE